uniref:Uncharacterized protein n=1 Tax=Glossina morsitans morsitans TaxID=37546 RepID=A0A1B0FLG8_GLOMM
MHINLWIFSLWAIIVHILSWQRQNYVTATDQYHIQTDEGPERYFRYQTHNGQFRKEKRLQDGTVIGTEAWIDAAGYLRLKDYMADKQGYRILKSKILYVGKGTEIQDALKSAKSIPAQSGALVDGKEGLYSRPNSIPVISKTNYAFTGSASGTDFSTTVDPPILGYLSPQEAAKLEPITYLGFDHYPNELPVTPKIKLRTNHQLNDNLNQHDEYRGSATTERSQSAVPLPVQEIRPPYQSKYRKYGIGIAPASPTPITVNEAASKYGKYSTPAPFANVPTQFSTTANSGYNYDTPTYRSPSQTSSSLPAHVNALLPLYERPRLPQYNEITNTQQGFRYILPHHYHEESQINESKKAGSFGYVDPFGIRRVVYYNASPEKGFVHRNRNRYVGVDGVPFDEPKLSERESV